MTDSDLKPCPFCGGTAILRSALVAEDVMTAWVQCTSCGVNGRDNEDAYADFATAAADWNTRPAEDRLMAENTAAAKVLANCDWYWLPDDAEYCYSGPHEVVEAKLQAEIARRAALEDKGGAA